MATIRLVIGITGCSGIIYGVRLLSVCRKKDIETDLIISPAAKKILDFESSEKLESINEKATRVHEFKNLGAPISSGSVNTNGMIISPCSMKSIGSIANGITDNLITRAADVTIKEGRKLVLVPRETPMNQIHLENMSKLSKTGTVILPATPAFYHKPEKIEDLVNFIVGKILDQFNIQHQLYQPWGGLNQDEI